MIPLLYSIVIFVTVTVAAVLILRPLTISRAQKRLETVTAPMNPSSESVDWTETIARFAGRFAKLSLPSEGWDQSPLRLRFMHAGFRGESPALVFFGAKSLLAVGLPGLIYLTIALSGIKMDGSMLLMSLFSLAALGYYFPNVVLSRLVFLRQREIFENFPDAADLMLVCVESGLGLDAALLRVVDEMRLKSEVLAEELHLVNLELRAGNGRDRALRNLALRTGVEEVNTFATMLIQADRFGTSVGESLRVFSDDLRTKRQMRAEEMAAKIPLKLLFPLVCCIFPSLLLVLLGPAFIQVYRILVPIFSGNG